MKFSEGRFTDTLNATFEKSQELIPRMKIIFLKSENHFPLNAKTKKEKEKKRQFAKINVLQQKFGSAAPHLSYFVQLTQISTFLGDKFLISLNTIPTNPPSHFLKDNMYYLV